MKFNEDTIELAALEWLIQIGYTHLFSGDIATGEPAAERTNYHEVILVGRLRSGLERINTHIPPRFQTQVIEEAIRKVTRTESQNLLINNHAFHRLLTEGIDVSFRDGVRVKHEKVWLVDFEQPEANDWLTVNQFTIEDVNLKTRAKTNRRPDIVLFVNGLPLVVIELKNAADENATVHKAYNQLQTYRDDVPALFTYNALLSISDGVDTRLGALGAGFEHFKPWRTVVGTKLDPCPGAG